MKTNIIHILILAIILIVGWSLFTVLQDFSNSGTLRYDTYNTMGKGKKYLPLSPEDYSRQQKYPVYKVPSHVQTQIEKSQSAPHQPTYRVVENGYAINIHENGTKGSSIANRSASNAGQELAKPSTYNGSIGGSLSDGNRMVQALRSATDNRSAQLQRQHRSKKPYNDIPVGDGLYVMMLMAALYALYKRYIQ